MNEHVDYQAQQSSKVTKFLWWCAGADNKILKYSSYSDHVKYVGIGGVVLATAVLAFLSMGFAMHIIFNGNWFVTIPVSIVWALIIFNLDRFIVSSTGKGDGKEGMSFGELLNALPRLIMAILIGFCISAPLETYIFQREIEREWIETKNQLVLKKMYEIEQQYQTTQNSIEKERNLCKIEVEAQINLVKEKEIRVTNERKSGLGEQWRQDTSALGVEQRKLKDLRNKLDSLNNSLLELIPLKTKEKEIAKKVIESDTSGFLDQIMMLEKLSNEGKRVPQFDENTGNVRVDSNKKTVYTTIVSPAFWPIWLVRLLFMMLEIAPVLLKLMLIKGPYDYMSENVNQILEAKQGISIEHIRDEHNKIAKFKTNYNPLRIIKIVERQNQREAENAIEAIDSFAEKEKKDIQQNPDKYIKDNGEDKV
jgi:hypothetical protein